VWVDTYRNNSGKRFAPHMYLNYVAPHKSCYDRSEKKRRRRKDGCFDVLPGNDGHGYLFVEAKRQVQKTPFWNRKSGFRRAINFRNSDGFPFSIGELLLMYRTTESRNRR